jgi:hypothetical protein
MQTKINFSLPWWRRAGWARCPWHQRSGMGSMKTKTLAFPGLQNKMITYLETLAPEEWNMLAQVCRLK